MTIALSIAAASLLTSAGLLKAALNTPSAAGAGAPGSILLVASFAFGFVCVFSSGVMTGLAISHWQ